MTAGAPPADLLSIGRVSRAHGLRGELRVELHFVGSDALSHVESVWLSEGPDTPGGAHEFALEESRAVPKAYLVKLEGVNDRNAAELLRGRTLWVARSALPETDDSEYYLVDLIGARVLGPDGELGTVVEIATHPSVDAIVIRTADGRSLEQPLVPAFVARVSVEEKLIELSSLDGLIG